MTREDAIYEIKQLAILSTNKNIERITEALEMAIEALEDDHTKEEYYARGLEQGKFDKEMEMLYCDADRKDEPQTERR